MRVNNPVEKYLRDNFKVGTKLIAIDPCIMEVSGKQALKLGKIYIVKQIGYNDKNNPYPIIESEYDKWHNFSSWEGFFRIKL